MGSWFASRASRGWAYWAEKAMGAVKVWCFLWVLGFIDGREGRAESKGRRKVLVDMFVNRGVMEQAMNIVEQSLPRQHREYEIKSYFFCCWQV